MQRFLFIVISLICLISPAVCRSQSGNPNITSFTVTLHYSMYDIDKGKIIPDKGRRDLPAPVECVIDLQERTLTSASPLINSIVRFQLLTADGETTLYDGSNPSDMIKFITTLPQGTYMICLVGEDYCLYGHFTL